MDECLQAFVFLCVNCSNFSNHVFMEGKAIGDLMINGQIRDKEVRVIGEDGEQLGIMSAAEAQKIADEAGLDLVKIAPTAKPPVCKIVDYGKFKYEQARKEKEAKKKQKTIEVKEIRMSPNIDTNDLNTKIAAARKFRRLYSMLKENEVLIRIGAYQAGSDKDLDEAIAKKSGMEEYLKQDYDVSLSYEESVKLLVALMA